MGYVYAIEVEGKNVFKFGVTSSNPRGRLRALQTSNYEKLRLVGLINSADYRNIEKEIHRQLLVKQISGEWFACDYSEVVGLIKKYGGKIGAKRNRKIKDNPAITRPRGWLSILIEDVSIRLAALSYILCYAASFVFIIYSVYRILGFYSSRDKNINYLFDAWEYESKLHIGDSINVKYEKLIAIADADSMIYCGLVFNGNGIHILKKHD
jgi:hypothetical protein